MSLRMLAASPVLTTPHTIPHRFVLMEESHKNTVKQYIVWSECFHETNPSEHCCYTGGHYFPAFAHPTLAVAFAKAHAKWVQKTMEMSEYLNGSFGSFEVV